MNKWLLLVLSSSLLNSALLMPHYCSWCVFLFLVPLFIYVLHNRVVCTDGFVWGLSFFAVNLYAIMLVIMQSGQGMLTYLFTLLLLLYCAVQAVGWFVIAMLCTRLVSTRYARACIWTISSWAFFVWLYDWFLIPFGFPGGYFATLPLLPLAHHPQTLQLLFILGTPLLLLLLMVINMAVALLMLRRRQGQGFGAGAVAIICMVPFLYGFVYTPANETPAYVRTVGCVSPDLTVNQVGDHSALSYAQYLNVLLTDYHMNHRYCTCIFMPESAFPFDLAHEDVCQELLMNIPTADEELYIVVGANSIQSQTATMRNCLFCMTHNNIRDVYVKRILMPLVEYIPASLQFFSSLFLKRPQQYMSVDNGGNQVLHIPGLPPLTACICSELFLGNPASDTTLLCLCNDRWFSTKYMQRLMFLYARYWALEHGRDLMYVSYSRAAWVGAGGGQAELLQ